MKYLLGFLAWLALANVVAAATPRHRTKRIRADDGQTAVWKRDSCSDLPLGTIKSLIRRGRDKLQRLARLDKATP